MRESVWKGRTRERARARRVKEGQRETDGTTRNGERGTEGRNREETATHIWRLVVLHKAAQRALGRAERAVEHVHVDFPGLVLGLKTTTNLQLS